MEHQAWKWLPVSLLLLLAGIERCVSNCIKCFPWDMCGFNKGHVGIAPAWPVPCFHAHQARRDSESERRQRREVDAARLQSPASHEREKCVTQR